MNNIKTIYDNDRTLENMLNDRSYFEKLAKDVLLPSIKIVVVSCNDPSIIRECPKEDTVYFYCDVDDSCSTSYWAVCIVIRKNCHFVWFDPSRDKKFVYTYNFNQQKKKDIIDNFIKTCDDTSFSYEEIIPDDRPQRITDCSNYVCADFFSQCWCLMFTDYYIKGDLKEFLSLPFEAESIPIIKRYIERSVASERSVEELQSLLQYCISPVNDNDGREIKIVKVL